MADEWMKVEYLLEMELQQLWEEGVDTRELLEQKKKLEGQTTKAWQQFYDELAAQNAQLTDTTDEPSDLESIRKQRPSGPRRLELPNTDELEDRIRGAWLGRAAGCQLGKPLEGLDYARIKTYLQAANAYPLEDYVPLVDAPEGIVLHESAPESTRGNFRIMSRDDDIDYTILGLHILEQYGPSFTTADVAKTWLETLPYNMVYTAERIAYRNLINQQPLTSVASWQNPYREWIGAQIRADGWAYGAAAWPEKAAEYAWRDASLSHTKNGIYGEMWAAAMIAAAFAQKREYRSRDDLWQLVQIGLSEIPSQSRLAKAIHQVKVWCDESEDWHHTFAKIKETYGFYNWVHTINNALVVTMALLHGEGDYGRSIGIAVMAGWDTDCNGATVGSVLGAILGASQLPEQWVTPLNDHTRSAVIGFDRSSFSALAHRSLRTCQKSYEQADLP